MRDEQELCDAIRSSYSPLGHVRERRRELARSAFEVLLMLYEMIPTPEQAEALKEWHRVRDDVVRVLEQLGLPLHEGR